MSHPTPPAPGELKAIVTDVDGTLTDEHRRLDPGAVAALRSLSDAGWPVVLATGNVLPIALALHRSLGLSGPIVAENGGLLYEEVAGRPRITRLADRAVALRAYRAARSAGLPLERLFTDRWRESEVAVEPTVPVRRIRTAVRAFPVHVESTGYAIHFLERGAGKLPALRRALPTLGLAVADCLVAGDGDNDIAMLREAGWGVSFPSGSPGARRAASYVARAPHARGFVEALKDAGVYARSATHRRDRDARRRVRTVR